MDTSEDGIEALVNMVEEHDMEKFERDVELFQQAYLNPSRLEMF